MWPWSVEQSCRVVMALVSSSSSPVAWGQLSTTFP
jgi:hypothetical protein